MKSTITITYCPKCGWLLRASWLSQELLTTFVDDLKGVMLSPSENAGQFTIELGNAVVWDRKTEGRFPEIKELKQLIRGIVAPEKDLGHSDRKI